ncbi:glycosyltransferase family 4 protein [Candidatus Falkowbacteria bacterium]|jgi:glycosyltransferase involved in cell wall biosynthesis|nr:glycosyltransferase family 4 protein [Candidatus Falkowbacteria bacterium]
MKIGVDARVLMDKYYSGVSEYAANLLKALLLLDPDNEYKLFYNSFKNLNQQFQSWNRPNSQVVASRVPNKIFNYLGQKIFSYPKIDKKLGGVDIFWSPHFNFTSLEKNTKKIITVHDLSFLRYPEFFSIRKNIWHRALRVKKIIREADRVIAVSENTKNDIVELVGVAPEKVKVIYSGNNALKDVLDKKDLTAAEKNIFNQAAKEFLAKKNLKGRLILYLGTIEPRKNISGLITAYNALRDKDKLSGHNKFSDLKLVLAGADGWKNKQIYTEWKKSPYQADIIFLGYISQKEKEILYSSATVFVYPSYYEGFGFPPLEAMTYGLPVICSNISSLPEVVAGAALMINPFESQEIAEALEIILSDTNLRESFIQKGYERAKIFTWKKTAEEYLKIFRELNDQQ